MPGPKGSRSNEAGKVSSDGFLVPPQGRIEHTFYYNTAPSALSKAEELMAKGKVHFPAAIVINNETIGRRTGTKAIPKSWWADFGSIATAFVFSARPDLNDETLFRHSGDAVISAFNEFSPAEALEFRTTHDFFIADRKAGRVTLKRSSAADIVVVHLNCTVELAKAPAPIATTAANLVDFIDTTQLPMGKASTFGYALLLKLMTTLPRELVR